MKIKEKYIKINFGSFQMYVAPSCFGMELYKENNYEPFSSEIVRYLIRPDSIFVDVGAYYGYYSLLASQSQKNVKIIAFEPAKENFNILKMNLKQQKIKNFEIYNQAASNKEGIVSFNFTEASDCAGFYNHHLSKTKNVLKVKTAVLDNILDERKVDFIKIDVEGHEIAVLEGLRKSLKNNKLVLLVEFNPTLLEAAGHKPEDLLDFLQKQEFEVYFLDEFNMKYYKLMNGVLWREIEKRDSYEGYCTNLVCIKKQNTRLVNYFENVAELLTRMLGSIAQEKKLVRELHLKINNIQSQLSQRDERITALESSKFYKARTIYHKFKRIIK